MKETGNPIAWQSRTWLMDALAALMEEKKFEEITVVEICRRADLSRRTFYRNYSSKEDLFRSCCERLCREYVRYLERDTAYFAAHITEVYFSFWKEHKKFLRSVCRDDKICCLIEVSNMYWPEIYGRLQSYWKETMSGEELEYCLFFNMGGLWNIMMKWLFEEPERSPCEMERMIRRSLQNLLAGDEKSPDRSDAK